MATSTAPAKVRLEVRQPGPPTAHPLATRSGAELLLLIVAAMQHWAPLTERQRTALRVAYRHALDAAVASGVKDGDEVELPALPADTHPATARSLERRRLVAGGQLTELGAEVVRLAADVDMRRKSAAAGTGDTP
jgi:hypothetical protein